MGTVRRNNSRKQKECCKNMTSASPSRSPSFTTNTKTCTPNNEEKLVDLNRRLLAALLDDDYNNNSNYNDDAKSTPPAPEDRITLFPEDEDEPIIKISKVEKARSQRRKSMPAVKNVKTSTYVDENSKPDPGFWNELVDIKSRLQKLEVQNEFEDNNCNIMGDSNSNSTTTTHTTTIASVFDKQHQHQQQPLSPLSSSNNTISSSPLQPRISVHQKRLQDAFAIFEHKQQYTSTKPNPMLKSMATVIAETISINQKLWAAIPQDLGTDARSLVALQKSSDTQLRELTESIYLLGSECEQPVDPIILPRYQHQSSRRQSQIYSPPALNVIEDPILVAQQQQQYIPPSPATTATRPSSQYYYTNMEQQIQSPRSRPSSYFHTSSNNVSSYQHLIKPLQQQQQQQQQTVNNNNNTAPLSSSLDVHSPRNSIRPIKVAGILDYSTNMNGSTTGIQQQHQTMGGIDQHHYYYHHSNNNNSRPTSKYYDPYHQRYTSGGTISLYDDL
ncbi:hypothetical protein BDC45DRAFT_517115 [Circinella umbellata]|nr:hypothetical protein BDC45DRAFT_517115 [Circinella umbellata]